MMHINFDISENVTMGGLDFREVHFYFKIVVNNIPISMNNLLLLLIQFECYSHWKIDVPNLIDYLNRRSVFEWCVVRHHED